MTRTAPRRTPLRPAPRPLAALRPLDAFRTDDRGAATAEYAIATMAAVGFASLLVVINPNASRLRDRGTRDALTERLRRVLHDYFAWATTTTMSRYHDSAEDVPDGLRIPNWSWQGLIT